ncbi:hypothetical protein MRX96_046478 [Rhipicephalus microplus]
MRGSRRLISVVRETSSFYGPPHEHSERRLRVYTPARKLGGGFDGTAELIPGPACLHCLHVPTGSEDEPREDARKRA